MKKSIASTFTFLACSTGLIIAMSSSAALADESGGLFVEPGITFESGSSTIDWPAPFTNSTGTLNGLGVMGRVGVHASEAIFVAADLRYSMPTLKDSSNNFSAAATAYNYGLSAGLQMPDVGLRLWAGYIIGAGVNPAEDRGIDFNFTGGNGYRIGGGFRIAMFSLNLEYQVLKYAETTIEKVGTITGSSSAFKYNNNSVLLSASFPLEL